MKTGPFNVYHPKPDLSFLYVIEFDQGTIKVGWTGNPEQRIKMLGQEAAQFGIRIANLWVSDAHPDGYKLEKELIAWCDGRATGGCRAEWFTGLDFTEVRDVADSILTSKAA